jgi:hypothetical protein
MCKSDLYLRLGIIVDRSAKIKRRTVAFRRDFDSHKTKRDFKRADDLSQINLRYFMTVSTQFHKKKELCPTIQFIVHLFLP